MTGDSGPEKIIRDIVQSQADAWCKDDAEGYAANAEDDLWFTNVRGQHWTGREEFVRVHDSVFRGAYAGSRLEAEVERVSFPGSGVAMVEILLRLTGARAMPAGIVPSADGVVRTRLLEVFEMRRGVWTLIACHNTVVVV